MPALPAAPTALPFFFASRSSDPAPAAVIASVTATADTIPGSDLSSAVHGARATPPVAAG